MPRCRLSTTGRSWPATSAPARVVGFRQRPQHAIAQRRVLGMQRRRLGGFLDWRPHLAIRDVFRHTRLLPTDFEPSDAGLTSSAGLAIAFVDLLEFGVDHLRPALGARARTRTRTGTLG